MEIIGLIIFTFTLVAIGLYSYRAKKDVFHPITFTSIFLFVTNIPFLFIILNDKKIIDYRIMNFVTADELSKSVGTLSILMALGFIAFTFGVYSSKKSTIKMPQKFKFHGKRYVLVSFLGLIITIIAYIIFLNKAGGIIFILNNLEHRAEFSNGNGFLLLMKYLLLFISLGLVYKNNLKINGIYFWLFFISFSLYMIMSISMGGRKPVLLSLLVLLMVIHYSVKKLKIFQFKYLIIISLMLFYIVLVPIIRQPNFIEKFDENPYVLVEELKSKSTNQIKDISYINTYIFIYVFFENHEKWYGKVFLNLTTSYIPSNIYKDKPPVDEGVYIRTLLEGREVNPNDSFKNLYPSSWPPETFGNGYMNFGIMGVLIFNFVLGYIKGVIYNIMIKNRLFIYIFIYSYTLINFEISNLRIVQNFSVMFLFIIWYSFVLNRKGRRV